MLGYGIQDGSTFEDPDLETPIVEYMFLNETFLWCCLALSIVFLWSGVCLFKGLWLLQRRKLLPFLLVSGFAVLFFIMATVWFFICYSGWKKVYALIPAGLVLLYLYWWLIVNRLLEEIHEEKKVETAAAEAEFYSMYAGGSDNNDDSPNGNGKVKRNISVV